LAAQKHQKVEETKGKLGLIINKKQPPRNRILVGIPMTGLLRSEWVIARYNQVIPANWSQTDCIQWIEQYSPLGYLVADARNIIVQKFMDMNFEWLFFIDHDVVLPPMTILTMNEYINKANVPMLSGLYFTKSVPSEPLVYRGRGNSYFGNWRIGDKVWVDGIPMGCTLIHRSIIATMYEHSEVYKAGGIQMRRVFESPAETTFDVDTMSWSNKVGTEDLKFCSRLMEEGLLAKAGWSKLQRKRYPFLIDTRLYCKHIDWNGTQYPAKGEELQYATKKQLKSIGLG